MQCFLPLKPGHDCDSAARHRYYEYSFYYDQSSGHCEVFLYRGCGGNLNRSYTKEECEKTCNVESSGNFVRVILIMKIIYSSLILQSSCKWVLTKVLVSVVELK